jgi:hypothetical protein
VLVGELLDQSTTRQRSAQRLEPLDSQVGAHGAELRLELDSESSALALASRQVLARRLVAAELLAEEIHGLAMLEEARIELEPLEVCRQLLQRPGGLRAAVQCAAPLGERAAQMLLEAVLERDDLAHLQQGFPMGSPASEEGEGTAKTHEPRVLGPTLREPRRDRGQLSLRLLEGPVVLPPVAPLE